MTKPDEKEEKKSLSENKKKPDKEETVKKEGAPLKEETIEDKLKVFLIKINFLDIKNL